MKHDWVLTQESFDSLLDWLNQDREQAALKYATIQVRLVKLFTCRGCPDAEELADETINRVTAKVCDIGASYSGDPALYFYGVAQKVYLEYRRTEQKRQSRSYQELKTSPQDISAHSSESETEYDCLERCMQRLSADNRRLVIEYYREEKRAKIDQRKRLAEQLGIALNALRIRAHRIRLQLQECVQECVATSAPGETFLHQSS